MAHANGETAVVGSPMFVHDFVAVGRPVDSSVLTFTSLFEAQLATIVRDSWNTNAHVLCAGAEHTMGEVGTGAVKVGLSGHHVRRDAAIINVRWEGDGWLPALDADLELVAFGQDCTHLHLMGRYELPTEVDRFSPLGSLIQRVTVMAVRGFLVELGVLLEP